MYQKIYANVFSFGHIKKIIKMTARNFYYTYGTICNFCSTYAIRISIR